MLFTYSIRNEPSISTTTTPITTPTTVNLNLNLNLNTKTRPPTVFDGIRNLHYIAQSTRSGCSTCG